MGPTHPKDMKPMERFENGDFRRGLAEVFSGYRAEWLGKEVFELFTEPGYFPQLTTSHPCFLIGGRGTGKTTALRCLSYLGQEVLQAGTGKEPENWPYFGMYYRVNTNHVRAFSGPELSDARWIQLFAHYINLEFCELVLHFLDWYGSHHREAPLLGSEAIGAIGATFSFDGIESASQLTKQLKLTRLRYEATINNIADAEKMPTLSMQAAPIDEILREVKLLPQFAEKTFFFLVDEYENLDNQQQRVFNTLIKHCGSLYSFKVGVKELGFRERSTLNALEQLVHPADYKMINIADELGGRFPEFASRVCKLRLERVLGTGINVPSPQSLFPELSVEEESIELGILDIIPSIQKELNINGAIDHDFIRWIEQMHPLELYTAACRSEVEGLTINEKLSSAWNDLAKWHEQYDNHKSAYLYSIRRNKRGIRKYFAGWHVFCLLAAGNIRYLLELVDQALTNQLDENGEIFGPVSAKLQTEAAQTTGQKNLRELEGLSLGGAKLTRLLLGLGRIFQIMAEDPIGHTAEVNQFHLSADFADSILREQVTSLVAEGIMHLALLRYAGSKLQDQSDIRQFDYSIHPIFAPFFGFSHRRKRKIELSDKQIWDLIDSPTESIRTILRQQKRPVDNILPEQLALFAEYYALPH